MASMSIRSAQSGASSSCVSRAGRTGRTGRTGRMGLRRFPVVVRAGARGDAGAAAEGRESGVRAAVEGGAGAVSCVVAEMARYGMERDAHAHNGILSCCLCKGFFATVLSDC